MPGASASQTLAHDAARVTYAACQAAMPLECLSGNRGSRTRGRYRPVAWHGHEALPAVDLQCCKNTSRGTGRTAFLTQTGSDRREECMCAAARACESVKEEGKLGMTG
jgi:hypothetical protein